MYTHIYNTVQTAGYISQNDGFHDKIFINNDPSIIMFTNTI